MATKKKTSASTRSTPKSGKAKSAVAVAPKSPVAAEPAAPAQVAPKRGAREAAVPVVHEESIVPAEPADAAKKRSALESAVQVLREEGRPMTCGELIAAMAAKNYWTSPAGKTPASTLYASILKEVTTKGTAARFVKVARGQFALRASAS